MTQTIVIAPPVPYAFPQPKDQVTWPNPELSQGGLTKREWFAGLLGPAVIAQNDSKKVAPEKIAAMILEQVDALIKGLAQ